jgi:hypothetical protein
VFDAVLARTHGQGQKEGNTMRIFTPGVILIGLPALFCVGILTSFAVLRLNGVTFMDRPLVYILTFAGIYVTCSFPMKKIIRRRWTAAFAASGVTGILAFLSAGLFSLHIIEEACDAYNVLLGIENDGH